MTLEKDGSKRQGEGCEVSQVGRQLMTQAELTSAGKAPLVQQDLCASFDLALQRHDNQESVFPPGTGRADEDLWMRLYYRGYMDGTLSNMESP